MVSEEKDIPKHTVLERWKGYKTLDKNQPQAVEIVKNPSMHEINKIRKQQEYGDEIAVILTNDNVYAFRRDLSLHKNIVNKLGLSEYIGGLLGNDYILITDTTTKPFRNSSRTAETVKKLLPHVKDISYFNEAIVGDWEEYEQELQQTANRIKSVKIASKSSDMEHYKDQEKPYSFWKVGEFENSKLNFPNMWAASPQQAIQKAKVVFPNFRDYLMELEGRNATIEARVEKQTSNG